MKRFRFQLESVLDFKRRSLDMLMTELSEAQSRAAAQEEARDRAAQRLTQYDADFARKRQAGFTNIEAIEYEAGQRVLEQRLGREQMLLEQRLRELEMKRQEVVTARQETHAIERLREIRHSEYDRQRRKRRKRRLTT